MPISSSGQTMIIATNAFGISEPEAFSLGIFLHLGTTIAVLVRFRKEFIKIIKACYPNLPPDVTQTDVKKRNWILFATIGTAITGLPLYIFIRHLIAEEPITGDIITLIVAGLLLITGVILLWTRKKYGENRIEDVLKSTSDKHSFLSGLVQGTSILPGISRSAVTVSANLMENYEQNNALKLSFLMSVPVAFAAIAVDVVFGEYSVFGFLDPLTIVVVTAISFVVGYLTMEVLLRIAQKIQFGYFCVFFAVIAFAVILPFLFL
ncbi:MAG: undecaprenyl-diphosphate phosphatase [Candidatus Helarchaeota archaeon]|nr:undecaprenyl-diphosphate phosphatase [Candidatus Helarchaeota archaeon]